MVNEKCPACGGDVEILLENARKENDCPSCGKLFIPRHSSNPAAFQARKPDVKPYQGIGALATIVIIIGVLAALFVSFLIGLLLLMAGVIVILLREIAAKKR